MSAFDYAATLGRLAANDRRRGTAPPSRSELRAAMLAELTERGRPIYALAARDAAGLYLLYTDRNGVTPAHMRAMVLAGRTHVARVPVVAVFTTPAEVLDFAAAHGLHGITAPEFFPGSHCPTCGARQTFNDPPANSDQEPDDTTGKR